MADGTAEEQALVGKRWDEFVAQHLAKTTPPALKPSTNLHTVLERARRLHGDGIALLRNKSSQQALEQAYVVLKKFARLCVFFFDSFLLLSVSFFLSYLRALQNLSICQKSTITHSNTPHTHTQWPCVLKNILLLWSRFDGLCDASSGTSTNWSNIQISKRRSSSAIGSGMSQLLMTL